MTKTIRLAAILSILLLLAACAPAAPTSAPVTAGNGGDEAGVRSLVEDFGKRLKMVSLLSPTAAQDIRAQYAGFVSSSLLESWMQDVSQAPGRMVSSPWPDRIEITEVEKQGPDKYLVTGYVVEITSTEVGSDAAANKIPVRLLVEGGQGRWLITEYSTGP